MALPYVTEIEARKIAKQEIKESGSQPGPGPGPEPTPSVDAKLLKLLLPLHLEYGNTYPEDENVGSYILDYFTNKSLVVPSAVYSGLDLLNDDDGFSCPFIFEYNDKLHLARIIPSSENSFDIKFSPLDDLNSYLYTGVALQSDAETGITEIVWDEITTEHQQ